MNVVRLEQLALSFSRIPPESGMHLAHAAAVCLDHQGHRSGVVFEVRGFLQTSLEVAWHFNVSTEMRQFWNDLADATEQGAYAIAVLAMNVLTDFELIERAKRKTGFDWWLGYEDNSMQKRARLEVSGILQGNRGRVADRLRVKSQQAGRSTTCPTYVAIVEFSAPLIRVVCQ